MDVAPAIKDIERLAIVALAATHVAGHEYVRQEVHLDAHDAIALAGFAATAFDIEAETTDVVTTTASFGNLCEQFA